MSLLLLLAATIPAALIFLLAFWGMAAAGDWLDATREPLQRAPEHEPTETQP